MVQSQFNSFLLAHFFSEGGGLRNVLIPLLGESSKKGMYCKCVRNGGMSIYTQTRMYSELHIQCPWKTRTRDGHASDTVRLLYAGCFVLSLCLHIGCPHRCFCQEASILPLFRIK